MTARILSILPSRLNTDAPGRGSREATAERTPIAWGPVTLALVGRRLGVLILVLPLLAWPVAASAQQVLESAGSRALGMAGAFVGVADDATAVHWNPAGLATGPPAGITIGWVDFQTGNQKAAPAPGASRRTSKFVSLGTWPIGLSYGHFEEGVLGSAAGGATQVDMLRLSQFGATVVQTVTPGLVVGSTLKYLRGTFVSGLAGGASAHDALVSAADLTGTSSGRFDLDLGAMADFGRARLGLMVRNVRQSTFTDGAGTAIQLGRQARMGLAVMPAGGLTLAMDLDLDTVDLQDGPRRILAVGAENRFAARWSLRGGLRWSLEGPRRMVGALGLSVAVQRNLWLDAHYSRGRLDADRGFGVALRAGF